MARYPRTMALLAAAALSAPAFAALAPTAAADTQLASLSVASENGVPGKYVVFLKESTVRSEAATADETRAAAEVVSEKGANVTNVLERVGAYVAHMDDAQLQAARSDSRVEQVIQTRQLTNFVEPRSEVASPNAKPADTKRAIQNWGLDRIDQPDLPLDDRYNPPGNGAGAHIYIVDSGIDFKHKEFRGVKQGRGWNIESNNADASECNGHGTHVGGIAAGATRGVAKGATLHPIRVMNCEGKGDDSLLVTTADWILRNGEKPAVVNMSLGTELKNGETSVADKSIDKLWEGGYATAVAAGNSGRDACKTSPARNPRSITVGWSQDDDERSFLSNRGECVDLFAPGDGISSAHFKSGEYQDESGTSMSAPHLAGAIAIYLGRYPNATPDDVTRAITSSTAKGKITKPRSTNNHLLQVGTLLNYPPAGSGTPTPVPTTQPTAQPTAQPTSQPTAQPTSQPTTQPQPNPQPGNSFENRTPQPVNDYQVASSSIQSSFAGGKKVTVAIDMNHPCLENLEIAITTPDGTRNVVKRSSSSRQCSPWTGVKSETYDMRSATDGSWKLEVKDNVSGNTGTLNGWSVSFS